MQSFLSPTAAPARKATTLQGVLWDMDGTLVDTEPYWIEAEIELVTRYGGTWTEEQARGLVGQALTYSSRILQGAGVELSSRQIIDQLIGRVAASVRRRVPWRPGARELLAELRAADIPCALVTMSEKPLAEEIQRQLPAGTFDFLLTGDMVSQGKPDPEPYQRALERLVEQNPQASASNVVALEDSLPGVTSAQAAGLITIAIPHFTDLPDHAGRVHWDTLEGQSVADLQALVAELSKAEGVRQ